MCPPPAPCECKDKITDPHTTPVAGFTLGHRKMGVQLEMGYPFFLFQIGYGLGSRFQLFVGYRGLYSLTSSPHGGFKVMLFAHPRRIIAISLTALGGWTHVRKDDDTYEMLVGGSGGFGEVSIATTARKKRHGVFINGGTRISYVSRCDVNEDDCYDHILDRKKGAVATIFAELGYELFITRFVSYYLALGADMFANSKALPAMVRFRTGVLLHF